MRILALMLMFIPGLALANDWEALDEPGAFAIMRHALAPGTGDPQGFLLGDCDTQRNLDARGRDQARNIGAAFRAQGIAFDHVLTSEWCRSRETAELLELGDVADAPALNSFFGNFSRRDRQTTELLELISQLDGRAMLVSHQVNISALTGRGTRSGEVFIVKMIEGEARVIGSVMIAP